MKDERAKHRTFTSMAQRRRWLALQDMVERAKDEQKERNDTPEDQAWQAVSRPSGEHPSGS